MISTARIREIIQLGNENRNLDYKGPFSWETATNDERLNIVKDVLAFSNTRDGGVILIGVDDKSGCIQGLTEEQSASFDQTTFNNFLERHTDPRHTCKIHRIVLDGSRVVVIDIPEFPDVPILCAREAHSSSDSRKQILKRSALYKRTEKASSELIQDADDMRELLNRALLRRQDDLLRAFKQIIRPHELFSQTETESEFKAETESARRYFSELDDGKFVQLPRWTVEIRPETYFSNRIPTPGALQQMVQGSAISLRGWTFPIAGRRPGAEWANFESGTQSFNNERGVSPEALRVYKSGLILWSAGFWEDASSQFAGQNVKSFISVIFSVTEWMLFAKRFLEEALRIDENARVAIQASGIKGRKLISADPFVGLHGNFSTELPSFEVSEIMTASDLRADSEAIARKIIRRIFELFNWNDPDESMLTGWQRKLLLRQF